MVSMWMFFKLNNGWIQACFTFQIQLWLNVSCLRGFLFVSPSRASENRFHLKIANVTSVNLAHVRLIYIPLQTLLNRFLDRWITLNNWMWASCKVPLWKEKVKKRFQTTQIVETRDSRTLCVCQTYLLVFFLIKGQLGIKHLTV